MKKIIFLSIIAAVSAVSFAQDDSPHHAAMHAEHWVDHHVSAPHHKVMRHRKPKHRKKSASIHHAAMHAERWIDHHVSAPHKQ